MDILRVWAWVPKPPALLTAWLQRFSAPVPAEYAEIELWGEVAGGAIFEDLATGDVLEASAFRAKYSQAVELHDGAAELEAAVTFLRSRRRADLAARVLDLVRQEQEPA